MGGLSPLSRSVSFGIQRSTAATRFRPPLAALPVVRPHLGRQWGTIQRMEDGDWQLAPIKKSAAEIESIPKYHALLGRGITIHHKISQTRLLEILKVNQKARSKSEGARRFWKAVMTATKGIEGSEQKRILNMPVNLEVGPKSVTENPGSSFDGNTAPTTRGRSYTNRSSQLQVIDVLFLEKQEDLTDEDWNTMAEALEQAVSHHKWEVLSPPLVEQWTPVAHSFRRQRTDEENARIALAQAPYLLYTRDDFSLAYRGSQEVLEAYRGAFQNSVIEPDTPVLSGQFAEIDDVS